MKAVMKTLLILVLVSLSLSGLTGCGQKGDLFLPATKTPVATPAEPMTEPAPTQPEHTKTEQQQQPAATGTVSTSTTPQAQLSNSDSKR